MIGLPPARTRADPQAASSVYLALRFPCSSETPAGLPFPTQVNQIGFSHVPPPNSGPLGKSPKLPRPQRVID